MNNAKILLTSLTTMGLSAFCMNLIATTVLIHIFFYKKLNIIMFEILQRINPMGISASLEKYKNKQYFINMKMSKKILR